jgi:hypothetical protein
MDRVGAVRSTAYKKLTLFRHSLTLARPSAGYRRTRTVVIENTVVEYTREQTAEEDGIKLFFALHEKRYVLCS